MSECPAVSRNVVCETLLPDDPRRPREDSPSGEGGRGGGDSPGWAGREGRGEGRPGGWTGPGLRAYDPPFAEGTMPDRADELSQTFSLIRKARGGDAAACERLFERY